MPFAATIAEPWVAEWNRHLLEVLFQILPHHSMWVSIAEFLVRNHLITTWLYAAVFYLFWRVEDERTVWRRGRLLEIVLACMLSISITLVVRPWIGWPSPARSPTFQILYPVYLWGAGTRNCFPSHSTLVYFLVAVGLWPLRAWLSLLLAVFALVAISFPRIYIGGHYPVDVFASVLLALISHGIVRRCSARTRLSAWLARAASAGWVTEVFLFLWLFELAEGFRSARRIFSVVLRAGRHLTFQQ